MKFDEGIWLRRPGIRTFSPSGAFEAETAGDRVRILLATDRPRRSRGDLLTAATITLEVSAPGPGTLRVRLVHWAGARDRGPRFDLALPENAPAPALEETPEAFTVRGDGVSLRVSREDGRLSFFRDGEDRPLVESWHDDLAYARTDWRGEFAWSGTAGDGRAWMRQRFSVAVGECFYGLGERFGAFVKNGQSVEMWNEDGGTASERAYKNVPFLLSSRGWGLFANHPERVSWEVCSERVDKVQLAVPGEALEYFLFAGPTPRAVLSQYTALSGRPALPPPWSFGLWLSTSFTTEYDERTILSFVDGMRERGIPLSVFHLDCFWMRGWHWCDFAWDRRAIPDPEGLLRKLHDRGVRVCVWINPYVAQASALFGEAAARGFLLRRENGDVWQWDEWQPGMGIVDFTNPAAAAWYQEKIGALLDAGVDALKTDFGERIPDRGVVWHDGSDPARMHNFYSFLYNRTVFETLERKRGRGEAVVFARSATTGGQRFPVHWGGDCWSTFEAMEQSLRGGLSLQLSGFGFWSHDIGGFEGRADDEAVYKRWAAFGLLSSHSRLHGSSSYRVPWAYGEGAVETLRAFARLKVRLFPYLWRAAWQAHREGVPTMRAMVLDDAGDPACLHLAGQYRLGDDLLVAPVMNPDGDAAFYLPEGDGPWTDWFTGERFAPGRWHRIRALPFDRIPLLARPGAVVPLALREDAPDCKTAGGAEFRAFGLRDGARGEILDREGSVAASLDVAALPDGVWELRLATPGIPPGAPVRIALAGPAPERVEGAVLSREGFFSVLSRCAPSVRLRPPPPR